MFNFFQPMKLPIFLLVGILVMAYLYAMVRRGSSSHFSKDIPYGQFTVRIQAIKQKNLNLQHGIVNVTNVAYTIWYAGKPIVFPEALQNNTGLPFLWAVYALPGTPTPTLVAGSQSLYLISGQDGKPLVEPLVEQGSSFASLQFLDGANGQPGPFYEVAMKQKMPDLDTLESLAGGRYLMVSEQAVLDVATGRIWRFNRHKLPLADYGFPNPHGALAFSPDQQSIVFKAQYQGGNTPVENWPDSEYALVVYHFKKDSGYVVPFDPTATRMNGHFADFNQPWFTTFFAWKKEPAGERLEVRQLQEPPNWTGQYDPSDHYYTLYPVKPSLLPILVDFVLAQMGWSKDQILQDTRGEYAGHCVKLGDGAVALEVCYRADDRKLTLSKELYATQTPEYAALVKKIATAFNAELAGGHHQVYFGRVLNETKRVHGLAQPQ